LESLKNKIKTIFFNFSLTFRVVNIKNNPLKFWDIQAYNSLLNEKEEFEAYLVINDTLETKHPRNYILTQLCESAILATKFPLPFASGVVHDTMKIIIQSSDPSSRKHISTFAFVLNLKARNIYKNLYANLENEFIRDSTNVEWARPYMDRTLFNSVFLLHLEIRNSPLAWRKGEKVSTDDLYTKFFCVLFEHAFTQELLSQSGVVLPINRGMRYQLHYYFYLLRTRLLSLLPAVNTRKMIS
jgi:hypothetical protein